VPIIFGNPDGGLVQKILVNGHQTAVLDSHEIILILLLLERHTKLDNIVIELMDDNILNIVSNKCSIRAFPKALNVNEYSDALDMHYDFNEIALKIVKKFEGEIQVYSEPHAYSYDVVGLNEFEIVQRKPSSNSGSKFQLFQVYFSMIRGLLTIETFGNEVECRP